MNQREKLYEQFENLIATFSDDIDGTVYHYTSSEGFRGIVESNEIWLTNTSFLNDRTECRVLQGLEGLFSENDFSNDIVKEDWNYFVRYTRDHDTYYIASFSKVDNSLEQWRAYGNFCIGFNAKRLNKGRINLYECVYNEEDIRNWILEKEKVPEWNGDCLDDQSKRIAASVLIFSASIKLKNMHFKREDEIRLFVVSHHKWDFPNSPSMYIKDPPIHFRDHVSFQLPIPYVKFYVTEAIGDVSKESISKSEMKIRKLDVEKKCDRFQLPIDSICIGPMPQQKEEEVACRILLSENGYENVTVSVSDIPYRGF